MPVIQPRVQGMGEPHTSTFIAAATRAARTTTTRLESSTSTARPRARTTTRSRANFNTDVATRPVKVVATSAAATTSSSVLRNPKAAGSSSVATHSTRTRNVVAQAETISSSEVFATLRPPVKVVKPIAVITSDEVRTTSSPSRASSTRRNVESSSAVVRSTTTERTLYQEAVKTSSETDARPTTIAGTERVFGANDATTRLAAVVTTTSNNPVTSSAPSTSSNAPVADATQRVADTQAATTGEEALPTSPSAAAVQTQAAAQTSAANAQSNPASAEAAASTSDRVFNPSGTTPVAAVATTSQASSNDNGTSSSVSFASLAPAATSSPSAGAVQSGTGGQGQAESYSISSSGQISIVNGSPAAFSTVSNGPGSSSASSASTSTPQGNGSTSQSSNGRAGLFHTLPRSTSLALTALLALALVALIGTCVCCLFMRRRRRRSRGNRLGSDGGSPQEKWNEKYTSARELNDSEANNPFRDVGEDAEEDDDLQPEALWRRRLNRLNTTSGWTAGSSRSKPAPSATTADMSERRASTSTWTSFDSVGMFDDESEIGTLSARAREGSRDMSISGYSAGSSALSYLGAPAQPSRYIRPYGDLARHPLATSFVPVTPSQYSEHSEDTPTGSPTRLHPYSPTSRTRSTLPGFDLVTLSSNSPPVPAASILPPTSPGSWRFSLDRIMGNAVDFLASKTGNEGRRGSRGSINDNFTVFESPRRAPPTPKMSGGGLSRANTISVPPKTAATMGMFAPVDRSAIRRRSLDLIDSKSSDVVEVMTASHVGSAMGVRTSLHSANNSSSNLSTASRTGLGLPESIVPSEATHFLVPSTSSRPSPPTHILITAPSPELPSRPYAAFQPSYDPEDVSPTSSPQIMSPKVFTPTSPNPDENPFADHNASIFDPPSPPRARANALIPSATRSIFSTISPFAPPRGTVPPSPIAEEDETSPTSSPSSMLHGRSLPMAKVDSNGPDGNESSTSEESSAPTIRARRSSATSRGPYLPSPSTVNSSRSSVRRDSLTGLPTDLILSSRSRRSSTSSQSSSKTAKAESISNAFTLRRSSSSQGTFTPTFRPIGTTRRSNSVDLTSPRSNILTKAARESQEEDVTGSEGSSEGSDDGEQKYPSFEEMEKTRRLMVERRRRSEGEVLPRM